MVEHHEACPEWQADIASWAVAQGDPSSEAALLDHLSGCDRCRAEAEGLLAVAAVALAADPDLLADPAAERPVEVARPSQPLLPLPVDLGDRISARIRRERRGHLIRRSLVAAVGAAAAAVVLVGAVALRSDGGPAPVRGDRFAFTVHPADAPAAAVVGKDVGSGSLVQLTATHLDPNTTYALWLTPPGGSYPDRVPAGTFRPDADGTVDVQLHCGLPPDRVGRVWVTDPTRKLVLDTA